MYRCCIFDLDGTLVDSLKAMQLTVNLTMDVFELSHIDEDQTRIYVGDGYKKLMERALLSCGDPELVHYEEALVHYIKIFEKNCLFEVKPYEGIMELLTLLKHKGVKLAVLSNKPHARTLDTVNAAFGAEYFDAVMGEQDGINRKPDPKGVFSLQEQLEVLPEQCLYFGDTNTDMKTGKAAGVDTVGVTWGFRDRSELTAYEPKYLIDHPSEIYEAFEY